MKGDNMKNVSNFRKKIEACARKEKGYRPPVSVQDYRTSPVGVTNWEVCSRMLVHDLLELDIPEVKKILRHYSITGTIWGTYTMALPRYNVVNPKGKK